MQTCCNFVRYSIFLEILNYYIMKKLYILMVTFLVASFSYGQEMLLNGDFESWDDPNNPTSWTHVENVDQEATETHGGTYSAKHTGDGTKDLGQTIPGIVPGDEFTLSIWFKVIENDGTDARLWSKWKNGTTTVPGDEAVLQLYMDNNGGVWSEYTVNLVAPSGVDGFYFEVRTYTGAVVYWDDFSFYKTAGSSCPLLIETATATCDAETTGIDTYTVEIPFTVGGTETYTITPDSGTVGGDDPTTMTAGTISINGVNEGTDLHVDITSVGCDLDVDVTSPICYPPTSGIPVITGIIDGTLPSDGCNGSSGGSSPKVIEMYVNGTVNFTGYKMEVESNGAPDVASEDWYYTDISALGVRADEYVYLVPLGETTFVEMYPGASSNYITDGPSGNGNDAFRITDPADVVVDQFGTPTEVTGSDDFTAAWAYQDSYARRNSSGTANAGVFNVANWTIGADNEFDDPNNTCAYITGAFPMSVNQQTLENFELYPNPVTNGVLTIITENNLEKNIQIYDMLGKQVLSATLTSTTLNVSNLNVGIYIIKIEEAGRFATQKLVIE